MTLELESFETGSCSANKLAFDPSGTILAIALNNGPIKFLNLTDKSKTQELETNDEGCQSVLFDKTADYLISTGNGILKLTLDGTFRIFQ